MARMRGGRNACRILVEKSDEKRLLGSPRHRWEGNIETYLKETGWGRRARTGSIWLRTGTRGGLL